MEYHDLICCCMTCGNTDEDNVQNDVCLCCGETVFEYKEAEPEVVQFLKDQALIKELESAIF